MATKNTKVYSRKELQELEIQQAKQLNISVKNIKTFSGHDGMVGINVDIYYNNKKFAAGHDDAYGGGMHFNTVGKTEPLHAANRKVMYDVELQISKLPTVMYRIDERYDPMKNRNSLEGLVNALVNTELERKELARDAKKGIVYEEKDTQDTYIFKWAYALPKFFKLYPTKARKIVQTTYDNLISEGHTIKNVEFLREYGINV